MRHGWQGIDQRVLNSRMDDLRRYYPNIGGIRKALRVIKEYDASKGPDGTPPQYRVTIWYNDAILFESVETVEGPTIARYKAVTKFLQQEGRIK